MRRQSAFSGTGIIDTFRRSLLPAALFVLPLSGSVSLNAAAPARAFDPVAFFSGRTEGHGTVDEIAASPKSMHVTGTGTLRADGVFVIDQTVRIQGDPAKQRRWHLRQISPGRFGGTISDASGPVSGVVTGSRMQISYTMKGGMKVSQTLTLSADGRSLSNAMKVRKFGIVVATVAETIRKL